MLLKTVHIVLVLLKLAFGFELGKEFFFAETAFSSSGAVICRVWPFAVAV